MGPGCPVCITDMPEIDEGVALALQGVRIATYGDMIRVPGSAGSLADARAAGAKVDVRTPTTAAMRPGLHLLQARRLVLDVARQPIARFSR